MCLKNVQPIGRRKTRGIGYKAFQGTSRALKGIFRHIPGSTKVRPRRRWLHAQDYQPRGQAATITDAVPPYPSGFHVLLRLSANGNCRWYLANGTVYRVEYRGAHTVGWEDLSEKTPDSVVCSEIKILGRVQAPQKNRKGGRG